ncbi:hypothetical protein TVAG_261140 [Trichomonas vaginalis G3]|uniref:Uncharacterized protein n=1 Tax=Trichomonas vaginalis (strain ATCC PRA-98 / G3) TaxID=412133 RepID=A2FPS4_TRIV3|nr:hypothetical protein TVAGG3_0494560 [Trichomonas vaginalis G3]EAX93104.1 hypothetical protein TVAG_261140 [Trichomonas vaginalis G3]KAI5516621.1 hypothetical protein TVAGG3_0494560 [Trichomonas vaginalis G3]|eukprot:XP_001306034.1 hypothetical protein [Trichomonas vaginalis G3]
MLLFLLRLTVSSFEEGKAYYTEKFKAKSNYMNFLKDLEFDGFFHFKRNDIIEMTAEYNEDIKPVTNNVFSLHDQNVYFLSNQGKQIEYSFWRIPKGICNGENYWIETTDTIEVTIEKYQHYKPICLFSPITYSIISANTSNSIEVIYRNGENETLNVQKINDFQQPEVYPFVLYIPPSKSTSLYIKFSGDDFSETSTCNIYTVESLYDKRLSDSYKQIKPYTYKCTRKAEIKLNKVALSSLITIGAAAIYFILHYSNLILGYINDEEEPQTPNQKPKEKEIHSDEMDVHILEPVDKDSL